MHLERYERSEGYPATKTTVPGLRFSEHDLRVLRRLDDGDDRRDSLMQLGVELGTRVAEDTPEFYDGITEITEAVQSDFRPVTTAAFADEEGSVRNRTTLLVSAVHAAEKVLQGAAV